MSNESDNICIVCFKNVDIFSIGCCDHTVCFECSTRMRVLCRQNECPICRQDMQLVVFTTEIKPFAQLKSSTRLLDKKYNIAFTTPKIQQAFYKILEHRCKVCKEKTFRTFQSLYDHMRREHELHFCDLCVENLKILTSERRCYNKPELAYHRRKGDPDDKSHRGHPLCEFCDTRYMDNDDLYRHLRRDHLYCHFCDADGMHMYYSCYDYLREHFRQEHFLCEEGICIDEKFTPVFRTEIDLRAHRASEHGRSLGKAATKQARTLELEFTLKPRPRPHQDSRRRGPRGETGEEVSPPELQSVPSYSAPAPPDLNDFPTLGDVGGPSSVPLTNLAPPQTRAGAVQIKAVGRCGPQYDQHFPGLPSSAETPPATSVRVNINQDRKVSGPGPAKAPANLSIQVNHRPARNIQITKEAFPALSSKTSQNPSSSSTWVSVSSKKPESSKKVPAPAPLPPKSRDEEFPSLCTKFTANVNFTSSEPIKSNAAKAAGKKASSVMIPMEKSWPEPEAVPASNKTKAKKKKKGGSDDTAKKKIESPEKEKKPAKAKESALKKEEISSVSVGKPLPTADDWFDVKCIKSENKESDEEPSVVDTKFDLKSLGPSAANTVLKLRDEIFASKPDKPPPGFGPKNGIKAPPGFSIPASNGLTFTNSSGESFPIRSYAPYLPPVDFDARNLRLVTKVNEILLNDASLELFRDKSAQFRRSEISAYEYYVHCLKTMGEVGTVEVLPELIALLPDVGKQQELFSVLVAEGGNQKGKYRLEGCASCQQVIPALEMKQHLANHFMNASSWSY